MRDRILEDFTRRGYILLDEVWSPCSYFENYEVSDWGRVRHARTKDVRTILYNQRDVPYIGMWDPNHKRVVNKPVATLVAETFVPRDNDDFDTIIHLNANRSDVSAYNLRWRTRSFAINYHRQIETRTGREFANHTFECMEDGKQYHSTYQVAMADGVLPSAVFSSVLNNDQWYDPSRPWTRYSVWPTGKSYRSVGEFSFADTTGL